MLTTLTAPAFAGTWYIEDGDITISAGESGNNVTQNENTTKNDPDTIITNREEGASSHTVTIDAKDKDDKVEVTLKDVNIDASSRSEAAVSVTGKGDTTIELDGDNELKSGAGHAGLEHNKTDTSGELTIQDKDNNGSLEAAGGFKGAGIGSAGIGGGCNGSGNVTISGGTITAAGSDGAAGIGGGYYNGATVTITGDAVIKNASSTKYGAGIGGGNGSDGNVTISGNAKIENATGSYGAAGIGGGAFSSPDKIGNGNVVIKDNAKIGTVTGGTFGAGIGGGVYGFGNVTIKDNATIGTVTGDAYGAGIGGGYAALGDVTIEGNVTIKNAQGGMNAAGIGGGADAENDEDDGNGNQISIKSNESGAPTVNATGGVSDVDNAGETIPGGAGIGSGVGDATAEITIEGKVTIVAKAGESNAAIGDMNGEQVFTGLDGSITRYDSEGNDTTLPTDPGYPVPADTSSSGGGSAGASVQESVFPGLIVTDKDGQRISYTSIRGNNVLSLRVGRFTASLHASLSTLRQLRAEGIDTITFQTILCSTTLSVDELLAMGGEDAEAVLTHRFTASSLTVG